MRYFFDLDDGEESFLGQDGIEFASDDAAKHEARRYLLETARDVLLTSFPQRSLSVVIRSERGALGQFSLSYKEQSEPDWQMGIVDKTHRTGHL